MQKIKINSSQKMTDIEESKKLFVSIKISKHLKKKKFDELCFAFFENMHNDETEDKKYEFKFCQKPSKNSIKDWYFLGDKTQAIMSPTYQQVTDWLRNKFKIKIVEDAIFQSDYFMFSIGKDGKKLSQTKPNSDYYSAFEEAVEQALEFI